MPDFIAQSTLETIASLADDLDRTTTKLVEALNLLQEPTTQTQDTVTPQAFVERVLAWDEQLSRTRLLLPLCTSEVQVNENGRLLSLSELIVEMRSEFDSLARAQLEALIEGAPD